MIVINAIVTIFVDISLIVDDADGIASKREGNLGGKNLYMLENPINTLKGKSHKTTGRNNTHNNDKNKNKDIDNRDKDKTDKDKNKEDKDKNDNKDKDSDVLAMALHANTHNKIHH